jgi:hypothetical protein
LLNPRERELEREIRSYITNILIPFVSFPKNPHGLTNDEMTDSRNNNNKARLRDGIQ